MNFSSKRTIKVVEMLIALIGIFVLIQLIRKILGGSWSSEDIVIGLLLFNLGSLFTIGMILVQLRSDHRHLKSQFRSLADDFKTHLEKTDHK